MTLGTGDEHGSNFHEHQRSRLFEVAFHLRCGRGETRPEGLRPVGVFREASNPNSLILVWDNDKSVAETRGIVEHMMTNPELGALMVSAGVQGMPKFWVAD